MQNYTLTFSVPARVLVRVATTGTCQQDALANGHAAVARWREPTAEVESVDLEDASFLDMTKGEHDSPSLKSPTLAPPGLWQLVLLQGEHVYSVGAPLSRERAEAAAAVALAQGSEPYSHVALRPYGGETAESQRVARGGWEVFARQETSLVENVVGTWLTEAEALALFRKTIQAGQSTLVRLIDFTDRFSGPQTRKEIESPLRRPV